MVVQKHLFLCNQIFFYAVFSNMSWKLPPNPALYEWWLHSEKEQNGRFWASQKLLFLLTNGNDIQWYFCTVLLTCVAAWTNCWLCDSVQKYCCTVTSGVFCRLIQSNCSQISFPPPVAHHYHHHHIFSWSTTCIAESKNMCKAYTIFYTPYILQYTYDYISLGSF